MKKLIFLLIFSFTFVFASVGKITAVKGDVSVLRDTKSLTAKSGFLLALKDKVVTKGKSKALVLFNDNTSITVGKDSTLSVNEFVMDEATPSKSKTNFGFGKGVFRTITGKIGKINPKGFKIKTKSASIGIRGTTLDTSVKILPDGTEQVDVAFLKGRGMITNNSTGVTTPVNTGQRASMNQSGETKVEQGKLESSDDLDEDSNELGQNDNQNNEDDQKQEDNGEQKKQVEKDDKNNDPNNKQPDDDPDPLPIPGPRLPPIPEPKLDETQNTKPVLTVSSTTLEVDQDTTSNALTLTASDLEDTIADLTLSANAKNGTVSISSDGKIIYTPNSGYFGSDTITIVLTDSTGLSVSETISVTVVEVNTGVDIIALSPSGDLIDLTNVTKQSVCDNSNDCDHFSTYMDYGYQLNSSGEAVGTYVNGNVTPSSVIESYINNATTASYTGGIAAFNNGNQYSGTISLDMNFGTKSFTGDISINNGDWAAAINSGSINSHGFSSSNISGSGEIHEVTSGNLSGKYYGPNADAAGGSFSLNSSNGSVNGTFGAKKQ